MSEATEFGGYVEDLLKKLDVMTIPCRDCGREIFFLKTNRGKLMPVTLELTPHWADCPGAEKFRGGEYNKKEKK